MIWLFCKFQQTTKEHKSHLIKTDPKHYLKNIYLVVSLFGKFKKKTLQIPPYHTDAELDFKNI